MRSPWRRGSRSRPHGWRTSSTAARCGTASEAAYKGGLVAGLRVGPFGGVRGLSKLVQVRFTEPVRRDGALRMPVRWEATGAAGELFPVLDGDLTLHR